MPPWMGPLTDWTGIAALITALGVLVQSVRTANRRNAGMAEDLKQLRPDHGASVADAIARIDRTVTALDHRLGHELGEIKADARQVHADHAARLRHLEDD